MRLIHHRIIRIFIALFVLPQIIVFARSTFKDYLVDDANLGTRWPLTQTSLANNSSARSDSWSG